MLQPHQIELRRRLQGLRQETHHVGALDPVRAEVHHLSGAPREHRSFRGIQEVAGLAKRLPSIPHRRSRYRLGLRQAQLLDHLVDVLRVRRVHEPLPNDELDGPVQEARALILRRLRAEHRALLDEEVLVHHLVEPSQLLLVTHGDEIIAVDRALQLPLRVVEDLPADLGALKPLRGEGGRHLLAPEERRPARAIERHHQPAAHPRRTHLRWEHQVNGRLPLHARVEERAGDVVDGHAPRSPSGRTAQQVPDRAQRRRARVRVPPRIIRNLRRAEAGLHL